MTPPTWWSRWSPRQKSSQATSPPRHRPRPGGRVRYFRPRVEQLEDRLLLAAGALTAPIDSAYGQLPLSFEANQGQTDPQVNFLAHGNGYSLFLTPTQAVLSLRQPADSAATPAAKDAAATDTVLRLQVVGADPAAPAVGLDRLPGVANYFIGSDPSQWHTAIPTYGRVEYQHVYRGIDLVYYGNQRQLEYDFVVAPGADPSAIRLGVVGGDGLTIDTQGELVVQTAVGPVVQHRPEVYQEVGGVRQEVASQFVLEGAGQVGFALGAYDSSRPLIIDPVVLSYSTYLGGSGTDEGAGIAVDGAGNAYVTGDTTSTNFPTTDGAFQTTRGGRNAFVTKLSADGTAQVYSTYLGGSVADVGQGIAVDGAGNAYVTGWTNSPDFPTTDGAYQTALPGTVNAFVTELSADGTALVYSTYLGGSGGQDRGNGIAVDGAGNAYVTGITNSIDFPTSPGAFQTTFGGGAHDAFATKLSADGTALVYSTYLGGSGDDLGNGIAVDGAGNAYVMGTTRSANFPTTPGAFQTMPRAAFVTKLNATGTGLVYSTYFAGSSNDSGTGIAVDGFGNAFVTGITSSGNFPTTAGAFQTTRPGIGSNSNAFVSKLNATGTALAYSTYLGGSGSDGGQGIAVDGAGNAYVTGWTQSPNFPTTAGAFQTTLGGLFDAFVTKLNAAGTALAYSTYLGGSNSDEGYGISVDGAGNAYVTGWTHSSNFPTTPGTFQTTYGGNRDAFVAKIGQTSVADILSGFPLAAPLGGPSGIIAGPVGQQGAGSAASRWGDLSLGDGNQSNYSWLPWLIPPLSNPRRDGVAGSLPTMLLASPLPSPENNSAKVADEDSGRGSLWSAWGAMGYNGSARVDSHSAAFRGATPASTSDLPVASLAALDAAFADLAAV